MTAEELCEFLSNFNKERREKMFLTLVGPDYVHRRLISASLHTFSETGESQLILRAEPAPWEGNSPNETPIPTDHLRAK